MSELGMAYDEIITTAHDVREVADTMETIKNICDGVVVVLGAASAIPGAAAVTGPVIALYESVAPTLGEVIDLCQLVDDYLQQATQLVQSFDETCASSFAAIDMSQLESFASAAP